MVSNSKKRRKLKRKTSFLQRGQIALYLLIGVIIAGAFVLVSGGPQFDLTPDGNKPAGDVVVEKTDPKRDSLQLKTIKFQTCGTRSAVDFLVDTSGSMSDNGKMGNVKSALNEYASNLEDKSVVGLRRFSSNQNSRYGGAVTSRLVPIGFYSSNKGIFAQQVAGLTPEGGTNTGSAFAAELQDLTAAVANPTYKDTPFNMIFVSDGIPEEKAFPAGGDCKQFEDSQYPVCAPHGTSCRCFDSNQDPTQNPQIAQQIRALKNINGKNVRVFSVLVYDPQSDAPFLDNLNNMMTAIASSPSDYYKTAQPADIKAIYAQIADKICEENAASTP